MDATQRHKLLLERQDRIIRAMNNQDLDRPPLLFAGDYALFFYANPDTDFAGIIENHPMLVKKVVEDIMPQYPGVDFVAGMGSCPRFMGAVWVQPTAIPGRELSRTSMATINFDHFMSEDDYDTIINKGWKAYSEDIMVNRHHYDMEAIAANAALNAKNREEWGKLGFPFLNSGMLVAPFDLLAYARGLENFYCDLMEYPDEVKAAMDVILEENEQDMLQHIDKDVAENAARGEATLCAMQPAAQGSAGMISAALFEEFCWPLFERQTNFLLDHDVLVRFHLDGNYTNFVHYFTALPKGKCIFDTDGFTDLDVISDLLGDRMAFTGFVPSATMVYGSPDEIYKIVREQIERYGNGYIVTTSCTIPANTPKANLDALYAAAMD